MVKVPIKTEYITLGQLLKFLSYVGSGGEAKIFLQHKEIYVNGEIENRRGRKLYSSDEVIIDSDEYKLIKNEN